MWSWDVVFSLRGGGGTCGFERCHRTVGFGGVNEPKSMGENLAAGFLENAK